MLSSAATHGGLRLLKAQRQRQHEEQQQHSSDHRRRCRNDGRVEEQQSFSEGSVQIVPSISFFLFLYFEAY